MNHQVRDRRVLVRRTSTRNGFSFVDVSFSIVLTTILLGGIMTSVVTAMRALPNPLSASQSSMAAFLLVDQMATELESALYVTQHTATTLGYTVPDRNGDGIPERVVYSWSGVAGAPLTRQYNGATPVTLAASVNSFGLTPNYTTNTLSYPAVGVEDASESLLLDYATATSGLANQTVNPGVSFGQYFLPTLPSGASVWRPTRVQFMAMHNSQSNSGDSLLQLCPANINLTPASTVLAQATLTNASMPSSFTFQQFSLSGLPPYSASGGVCLTVQLSSGSHAAILEDSGSATGELRANGSSQWTLMNNRSLMSQLYGKLTRWSGSQYVNSRYLTSMGISLQLVAASPVQTTTCAMLNHPEMLSGFWELKFDKNPTTIDVNGDAVGDWVIDGGGTFNMSSISNGVWQTSSVQLDTSTNSNFATTTVVDLRLQNTSTAGNGAVFSMNALRSGSTCAPLQAILDLQSDGTQTLVINGKSNDATTQTLITIPGLPNQLTDVNLIIDPVTQAVSVTVGGAQYGTFLLPRYVSSDPRAFASIYANGSNASFSYVRIRVLEQ